jgi:hypothetical protein
MGMNGLLVPVNSDGIGPYYSFRGIVKDDPGRPCPAVITSMLKEMFIDANIPLDENPMAYQTIEENGQLPPKESSDYFEEWEAESKLVPHFYDLRC